MVFKFLTDKLTIFENIKTITNSLKHPQISIILPFYKSKNTLDRAIQSILNQTFSNFELILISNNADDQSIEIATTYCKEDPRCTLIHEKRQGVVHAFNKALGISIGKYIARMDADDWSFPERLQQQFDFLETYEDYGVVAGQAQYIPHKPDTKGFGRYVNWSNEILEFKDIYYKQFVESPVINPTAMWRKEVSDKYGTYAEGAFPEDYDLWLRWLQKGVKFHKLNQLVIKWNDSDSRLTRTDERYSDEAFFEVKSSYLAKWLMNNNSFHPKVLVWGASKISRRRANLLLNHGIDISAFIDISTKRQLDSKIIHYRNIPTPDRVFVLVFLKEEKMRLRTVDFLEQRKFNEGDNYLLVS